MKSSWDLKTPVSHALLIGEPALRRSLVLSFLLPEKAHVRDRLLQGGSPRRTYAGGQVETHPGDPYRLLSVSETTSGRD